MMSHGPSTMPQQDTAAISDMLAAGLALPQTATPKRKLSEMAASEAIAEQDNDELAIRARRRNNNDTESITAANASMAAAAGRRPIFQIQGASANVDIGDRSRSRRKPPKNMKYTSGFMEMLLSKGAQRAAARPGICSYLWPVDEGEEKEQGEEEGDVDEEVGDICQTTWNAKHHEAPLIGRSDSIGGLSGYSGGDEFEDGDEFVDAAGEQRFWGERDGGDVEEGLVDKIG